MKSYFCYKFFQLEAKSYNKYNFHKHTFCVFKEVSLDAIQHLGIHYSSKSGSQYYFLEEGVYRISNHWGRAGNCRWKLDSSSMQLATNSVENKLKQIQHKVGYAKWTDFYPNNEQENLFYLVVNFETKSVDFYHKNNPNYDQKSICRNAAETAKQIKICREVLLEDNWSKHLNYNSLEELRKHIIHDLIYTNFTFIALKRNYII